MIKKYPHTVIIFRFFRHYITGNRTTQYRVSSHVGAASRKRAARAAQGAARLCASCSMQFPEARKVVQAWAEAVRDARDRSVRRVHVAACAVCSGAICGSCIHELGDEHVPGWLHRCRFLAADCSKVPRRRRRWQKSSRRHPGHSYRPPRCAGTPSIINSGFAHYSRHLISDRVFYTHLQPNLPSSHAESARARCQ